MYMSNIMLAEFNVGGSGLSHSLFNVFIWVLIGLIIWGLGKFFFPKLKIPAMGLLIWDGLFVLVAALVIINFLAGLAGHPLFSW